MQGFPGHFIKERHMYPEASLCLIIYQGSGS